MSNGCIRTRDNWEKNIVIHHVFRRRSVGIDSQIIDAKVSQIHCAIRWEGDQWVFKI